MVKPTGKTIYRTVKKMKAALLQKGVTLPTKRMTKEDYMTLFSEHCLGEDSSDTASVLNPTTMESIPTAPTYGAHTYGTRARNQQYLDCVAQSVLSNLENTDQMNAGSSTAMQPSPQTRVNIGCAGLPQHTALSSSEPTPAIGLIPGQLPGPSTCTASGNVPSSLAPQGVGTGPITMLQQPDTNATVLATLQSIHSRLGLLEQKFQPSTTLPQQAGQQTGSGSGTEVTGSWLVDIQGSSSNYNLQTANSAQPVMGRNANNIPGGIHGLTTFGAAPDDLPQVEIVSPNVRREIIAGKDINLASLLIPGANFATHDLQGRHAMLGEVIIPLKPDKRLSKNLNIQEFITAFTILKNVLCQTFPHRRVELDAYLREIIDMSTRFGGTLFYEYHKSYSARAAALLQTYNVKVDWSLRDTRLYTSIFAGCRANACAVCHGMTHTTDFCPLTAYSNNSNQNNQKGFNSFKNGGNNQTKTQPTYSNSTVDKQGRPRVRFQGKEICNNFNGEAGCARVECGFRHACLICKSPAHQAYKCAKSEILNISQRNHTKTNVDKSKIPQ